MNDPQHEKLSAFLDGELTAQEQNALVDQLANDASMRRQLSRFQLVSAQLQQDEALRVDASGIASAVAGKLSEEPTVLAPRRPRDGSKVQRLALGAALAATVAAVAISVAPQLLEPTGDPMSPETFAFAPRLSVPTVDATTVALGSGPVASAQETAARQRWKVLQPDIQNKLDKYLLEHSEFAGRLNAAQPNVHVGFISSKNAQR
jgi:sigma-E factor negative regulatory protein RseA